MSVCGQCGRGLEASLYTCSGFRSLVRFQYSCTLAEQVYHMTAIFRSVNESVIITFKYTMFETPW